MPRLLHILPHAGGGGEGVIDLLATLDDFDHDRCYLADERTALRAAPSLRRGLGTAARAAEGADLLHVMGDTATVLGLPLIRRQRAVWSTQGLHLLRRAAGPVGWLARRRARSAVLAAERTICSSNAELGELKRLAAPSQAPGLVEVLNGVPLPDLAGEEDRRAAARAELGIDDGQVVALYLGELEPRKRPLTAVDAATRAAANGAPLVLLVAGRGPQAEEIARRASDVVRPLGFRDDPERLLAAADISLMPSEREGLSLAVLEAMGHGLAMVVSDGPGNPEAVGDAGVVHPVGDVAALAAALDRLAGEPDERARLGAAARRRAEERFTVERFLADMRRELLGALEGPASR